MKALGFERTVCDCALDRLNCRHLPGYLIPDDLPRMAAAAGYGDVFEFARAHLLASPGALVQKGTRTFRIPTLVPARRRRSGEDGACIFLDPEERCSIHEAAPFGCAYFDVHQWQREADRRSLAGLEAILADRQQNSLYAQVWIMLDRLGKRALPPEKQRAEMRAALTQITREVQG